MGGANYEIRISGRVSDCQMPIFEGLSVTTEPVETVVHGRLPDQDAVYELLLRLQAFGLEVVGFRLLPGGDRRQPECTALRAWLPDQAALFGVLARVRLAGFDLVEVRRLPMASD